MKRQYLFLSLLLPVVSLGVERAQIDRLLNVACTNQGSAYIATRDELVSLSTKALPLLAQAGVDTTRSWQERLMARVVYERIARGKDIAAVRGHDWRMHPGYDVKWEGSIMGPGWKMRQLVIPFLIREGLWYYYIEITWKHTGELAFSPLRHINDDWESWCRTAIAGQPKGPYEDSPKTAARLGYDPTIAPFSQPEMFYLQLVIDGKAQQGVPVVPVPEPPFRLGTNVVVVAP